MTWVTGRRGVDAARADCYPKGMSLAMTCSECWTTVPGGIKKCPRCGAAVTGAAPSMLGLFKSYPWLAVVLGLSAMVTLWAATRRAPAPPPAPAPAAFVETPPAPTPEPEPEPEPPSFPAPEPAAAPAPEPAPVRTVHSAAPPGPTSGRMNEDGTFEPNGELMNPPGR